MDFYIGSEIFPLEDSPKFLLPQFSYMEYADLTEKRPFFASYHVILSVAPNILSGMLHMVLASSLVKI